MSPLDSELISPVWRDGIFDGRVVFVTGGAGSICGAQTRALIRLGANACIVGRNVEKIEASARDMMLVRPGAKVVGIGGCDVRQFENLQRAADRCAKELGGIDFVIAGAAGNFIAPLSTLSPNGFKSVIDIDLLGSFNTVKATIPHLVRARPFRSSSSFSPSFSRSSNGPAPAGRIIFVSATFHYTGMPMQAHVSAAKAGVEALMASVALEYGPRGVASNAVAPGPISDTEGMARLAGEMGKRGHDGIPAGRWGSVRDIADATIYLFSEAGMHVNGATLVVDGGAWRRQADMGVGLDEGTRYPDFLLDDDIGISNLIKDRRRGKKAKL